MANTITVYLAGEVHTPWRTQIVTEARARGLAVEWVGPVADHDASDACGEILIGAAGESHTRDYVGAGINAIRSSVALRHADIVLAHFTLDQRSCPDWTSAYEAGRAVTLGKPLIVMHDPAFDHALKELDRAALAVTRTPAQFVTLLAYVLANDDYSHQQSDEEDGS
jgi:YtoQ family protein